MWPHSPIARRSKETGEETTGILHRPQSPLFPPPASSFEVTKEAYPLLKKDSLYYIFMFLKKNLYTLEMKLHFKCHLFNVISTIRHPRQSPE